MLNLNVHIDPNKYSIEDIDIKRIVSLSLNELELNSTSYDLSIIFVDDQYMAQMNEQYRGYAQSTDVLSFESGEIDPETGAVYLGDILISYPFVKNQAQILENNFSDEITLMIIHGVLHLCGFDHLNNDEKIEMWALQSKILEKLDIHLNKLPE